MPQHVSRSLKKDNKRYINWWVSVGPGLWLITMTIDDCDGDSKSDLQKWWSDLEKVMKSIKYAYNKHIWWCEQRGRKAGVQLYLAAHAKLSEPDQLLNARVISTILKHMPPPWPNPWKRNCFRFPLKSISDFFSGIFLPQSEPNYVKS